MKAMILAIGLALLACGCTEQQRAKKFGGNASVSLPAGEKIVGATWKEDDLWILTRPMRAGEQAETHVLRESSSWGVLQGTVTITERAK